MREILRFRRVCKQVINVMRGSQDVGWYTHCNVPHKGQYAEGSMRK